MRLEDLTRLPCVLRATVQRPGFELRAVHCDSRQVDGRTGFLALRGLRTDGHRFLDAARAAGAPVLLVSDLAHYRRLTAQPLETLAGVILVRPGRTVLAELAADVRFHLDRDASPGTRYTYTVTAVDGADPPNESDASQPVSETAPETPDAAAEGGEGEGR